MQGHEGHRERMRRRFLRHGLSNFDDHNVLELLLFYALPRRDTNEIAHRLLERFGSLDRVFEATPEELMEIPGIGETAAALIRLVPETARRCLIVKQGSAKILPDVESMGSYFVPRFMNRNVETVLMLCLDPGMRVIDCRQVGSGGLTSASFSTRDVVRTAMTLNAKYVVLAHNHVSGIALPSVEDRSTTRLLRDALAQVDVKLLDHIIVAGDDYVSLADDGLL